MLRRGNNRRGISPDRRSLRFFRHVSVAIPCRASTVPQQKLDTMKPIALLPLIALAACQQPRPVLVLPPAELATCATMPAPPSLPDQSPETQRERDVLVLEYVLALREAWADCAGKVAGLARWRESVE